MSSNMPNWERTVPRGQSWGSCADCVHLGPQMTCPAFPDRIPLAIVSGEVDHLAVRPWQVGTTVFERKPGRRRAPATVAAHPSASGSDEVGR